MKVSELQDAMLDYWAGEADKAIGLALNEDFCYYRKDENSRIEIYSPSTDWSQGGPIIERERISLHGYSDSYEASSRLIPAKNAHMAPCYRMKGTTALQAAMRCFVASKFGDTVDDSQAD
jgi:hypothetical protein